MKYAQNQMEEKILRSSIEHGKQSGEELARTTNLPLPAIFYSLGILTERGAMREISSIELSGTDVFLRTWEIDEDRLRANAAEDSPEEEGH
jgi:hypothetical protein